MKLQTLQSEQRQKATTLMHNIRRGVPTHVAEQAGPSLTAPVRARRADF